MSLIDVDTDCLAQFNVYWIWDPENRFWIYNSDDGVVHCWWSDDPAEWHYVNWGRGHQKSTEVIDALPPDDLYPDYPRIE